MGVEDYNKKKIERLKDYKVAFDQKAMWADMQKKKKKRRGAFFFFTMALVALAIVFFTFCYSGLFSEEMQTIGNIDHKTKIKETPGNIIEEDVKPMDEVEVGDSNLKEHSELVTNTNATQSSKTGSQSSSTISNEQTDNNIRPSANSVTIGELKISGSQSIISDRYDQLPSGNGRVSKSTKIISTTKSDQTSSRGVNNKSETHESDNKISIEALDKFEFPYLDFDRKVDSHLEALKMNASQVVEVKPTSKPKFLIGMYAGIGAPSREVFSQGELLTDLDDETLEEISAGLELKYNLRPNLYVRGGIEYSHITDRRSESTFAVNNLQDVEDRESLGFQEGDVGIVLTTTKSVEHTIYQSYNVPVLLGWSTRNDRFNFFAEAGATLNLSNGTRGILPAIETFEGAEFIVGSTTQVSPIAGIGASYHTRNGMEFFLRSNWKASQYVTSARENEEGLVSQKYSAVRLQAGVRYGF